MAREGTPIGGRHLYIQRTLIDGADVTLVAYTNTQGSLGDNTVVADLTQPTQTNGYAPIVLSGTWSKSNGVAAYSQPAGPNTDGDGNPCWFPTGTWSAGVTGVALIYGSDVVHFFDYRDGAGDPTTFIAAAGKRLPVDLATIFGA
jgi:hypothetical protein